MEIDPNEVCDTLKHVLAYIKGTIRYGITYAGGKDLNPTGYVDSDFAGCRDT